jgi:hypothetical protein
VKVKVKVRRYEVRLRLISLSTFWGCTVIGGSEMENCRASVLN